MEKTFALIKPDVVHAKKSGQVIDMIENNGFTIIQIKKMLLDKKIAETFYAVHKDKPFFNDCIEFITSGPVVALVLEKENAIKEWRTLMGATDPKKALESSIRYKFGTSIESNAVHGSDSPETARTELALFFPHI